MRYAVYFCPAEGSGLDVFGRKWLATEDVPRIAPERLKTLRAKMRRYGWHATLCAPFALAQHASYEDVHERVVDIARRFMPFELPLRLDHLGAFLALRPHGDQTDIQALADVCVQELNALRAPLTEEVWQRRATHLDDVELALYRQFGYPYVRERYRFHMTLSAPASDAEEQALREWLSREPTSNLTAHIDAVTICCEKESGGDFEPVARIVLGQGNAV
jgi:hypothetical protein